MNVIIAFSGNEDVGLWGTVSSVYLWKLLNSARVQFHMMANPNLLNGHCMAHEMFLDAKFIWPQSEFQAVMTSSAISSFIDCLFFIEGTQFYIVKVKMTIIILCCLSLKNLQNGLERGKSVKLKSRIERRNRNLSPAFLRSAQRRETVDERWHVRHARHSLRRSWRWGRWHITAEVSWHFK